MNDGGTTVSLVLGSGGARGHAHIGVIQELEAQGLEIRSIAGSSMGALIGGIHAAGKLQDYVDWVLPLRWRDVLRLVDWTISGGGFIKGDRIIGVLRELVGDVAIEELAIPYTAVAVDLDAQREVWFSSGPLFDAVRASIAIPTVFRPHAYQGRLLLDGGLLNPLPVSPTLRDLTDVTIAVDVNGVAEPLVGGGAAAPEGQDERDVRAVADEAGCRPSKRTWLSRLARADAASAANAPGTIELFARTLDVVQETITRLKLAAQPPDLLITIPRNACAFWEFERAGELIALGRERTREALARWSPPRAGISPR